MTTATERVPVESNDLANLELSIDPVFTAVNRRSHQFVEMLISEGQVESQEKFASEAYQAHYERIRDKMFGKKPEPAVGKKPSAQAKKVAK